MTTNPLINALSASLYISLISLFFQYATTLFPKEDSALMPLGMLSLLVLSAAIMAFVFFYHPALMFIEGKKGEAVRLFLQTLGIFALITIIIFAIIVSV